MAENILEVKNLSVNFNGHLILDNMTFEINGDSTVV